MTTNADDVAIRAFLDQPDVVIFVGSGLSIWSGLPDWETLIRKLIDLSAAKGSPTKVAEEAFAARQLLEAADALRLTPNEIAQALRNSFGFSSAKPHEIHSLLVNLGPKRFITTNFDSLIEQELGLQGRLGTFRTVTSRQIAELADIVKASADEFVFKPHGDLSDADSIVLTSRDYERLIGSESNLVRRALETILVTRPILFIGYGLRDPDTSLVLRTLNDRYVGNVGHFVAILGNATDEHKVYWWDRFRIRIFSYPTELDARSTDAHTSLLHLLRRLVDARTITSPKVSAKRDRAKQGSNTNISRQSWPALIRYAARMIEPEAGSQYPIRVRIHDWFRRDRFPVGISRFDNAEIGKLIDECSYSFVLSGPAGSGKSLAVAKYMSRCGRRIIDWDSDRGAKATPAIPVLLDARLYRGNFADLAEVSVPSQLDLRSLSKNQQIVVILDSIDEMPAAQLDRATWRADFESFVANFQNCRTIYGTRRADLIGRDDLPVFDVQGLDKEVVEQRLLEIGKEASDFTVEFREALESPFLLSLALKFLGRRADIRHAPLLLAAFVEEALQNLALSASLEDDFTAQLAELAEFLTNSGRETIPISDLHFQFRAKSHIDHEWKNRIADSLVEARLMVSEIDAHVRFVHRTVTEYLASKNIILYWRSKTLDLASKLSFRRWDNSVAWAVTAMTIDEATRFIGDIYNVDPILAYKIVVSAEIGSARLWMAFLDCAIRKPPSGEQAHEIIYLFEKDDPEENIAIDIPKEASVKLRELMKNPDEIGGWAAAHYAPFATDHDLRSWIDRARTGDIDFNYANISGHALGGRLSGPLLDYFLESFGSGQLTADGEGDNDGKGDQSSKQSSIDFSFDAIVGGLRPESVLRIISWARRRNKAIRNRICSAIDDFEGIEIDQFFVEQLDRGIKSAILSLGMRLRYGKRTITPVVPKYTKRRFNILLADAQDIKNKSSFSLMLLRECASRDSRWSAELAKASKSTKNDSLRRALRILLPGIPDASKEGFVYHSLKHVTRLSPIERAALHEIHDDDFSLQEEPILQSLERNGRKTLGVISEFFNVHGKRRISVSRNNIDKWIDLLSPHAASGNVDVSWICSYLALRFSDFGREHILRRANDCDDAGQDFVLGYLVLRMSTVTTDDLIPAAANRLLSLYLDGKLDYWPTPGNIATERFVAEVVLPAANDIAPDRYTRENVELILKEAGERLDRRYFAPWQLEASTLYE